MPKASIPKSLISGGEQPHFANQATGYQAPDRSDHNLHRNILTLSKASIMEDAYNGEGGFADGYYLVPFPIESMYRERRELTIYKNFIRPIIDAMVNPVFAKPIERNIDGLNKDLFDSFIADCDNSGTELNDFMSILATETIKQGLSFVVIDNFKQEEIPGTLNEVIKYRKHPYVYLQSVLDVYSYSEDRFGNLEEITFKDYPEKISDGNGGFREEDRYRKWTKIDSVILKNENSNSKTIKLVPVSEPVIHNLGIIPVIPISYNKKKGCGKITPPLFDLAKIGWNIFNIDSELREVLRKQGFSFLCIQGSPVTNAAVGAGNVLYVEMEAKNMPQFVYPSADIPRVLAEQSEDFRKRLFEIAEQNGVTGVKDQKSGIAKEWDFQAMEFILNRVSSICKNAEVKIIDLFCKYLNITNEITSVYPRKFAPRSSSEDIKIYDSALALGYGRKGESKLKKAAFRSALPDLPKDEIDEVYAELDEAALAVDEQPMQPGIMSEAQNNTGMPPNTPEMINGN